MPDDRIDHGRERLTVPEAAALAGVSRQAVHAWFAQGHLTPINTGRGYRIDREEFRRFLAERRAAAAVGVKVATLRQWVAATARA